MEQQIKRKPNWNADETLALTSLVEENKKVLRGKLGPNLTSSMKQRKWQSIAETLAAMGLGPARTALEVEKKWHNVFSKSKTEISDHRKVVSGTGGGPPPKPLSTIAKTVCSVVGEKNACLSGIDGGLDSSLLQIDLLNFGFEEEIQPGGIQVVEGPPGTPAHIIHDPVPSNSTPVPAISSANVPETCMKRKIEELTYRKLQLEVEYLSLKIKRIKGEE